MTRHLPADEVAIYLHRDGPFAIFPIPDGRARIVADLGTADPTGRPAPGLAEVQALIDRRAGGGFRAVDSVWLTHFRINERKVAHYGGGRVFVAGDAAHIHSPAGGQGMNTGIQDAINLAWKLAMVIRGAAAPGLLASYSKERSAVGETVLRNATLLTNMATLSHPIARGARDVALKRLLGLGAIQRRVAGTMSEIDIAYPDSPLSSGPTGGTRLAPARYDGSPPGAGSRPLFALYTADRTLGAQLVARYPALLEPQPRSPPGRNAVLIVRPDGYVGYGSRGVDRDGAEAYLAALSDPAAVP